MPEQEAASASVVKRIEDEKKEEELSKKRLQVINYIE